MVITMKKLKVLFDFITFSVTVKLAFYRNVISRLTNNPLFPKPYISLATVTASVDKFEAAIQAAKDGAHTAISIMHDAEKVADADFRILAHYVDQIADGDETKLLSSGFHPSKQPVPPQKPILAVFDGIHQGSAKLAAKAHEDGGAFIWQLVKGPLPTSESEWKLIGISTQATYEVEGLEVGVSYYFRVAVVTPAGTTEFCQPVLKLIL
jgi:hypothetical protein